LRGVKETAPERLTDRKTDHYTGALTEIFGGRWPAHIWVSLALMRGTRRA